MALAGAGRADEVDHLVTVDEVQAGQGHDAVAVERWLERAVEAGQGLDSGQPGHLQGRLDPTPLAHGDLLGEQGVDRLDGADLAALELLDDAFERLQGAGHAQADKVVPDPLDRIVRLGPGHHAVAASVARGLPTAS